MTETNGTPAPTSAAGGSLEDRLADRMRELDELTRQHAATVEIIDIIARSTSGLQPVLDAVVGAAVRHCGADDATLFLRDGTESFGAAHEGPLPSGLGTRHQIAGSHLSLHIYRGGQTIHAPDTEALDPVDFAAVIAVARQRGVRALVAAPIRHAGEVIGYLLLRRREVGPFSARQIAMLETLASQAGVAVANAGAITELRQSLEQQTATSDILRIISISPTDIRPVFDAVAVAARRLCGAPSVGIFLRDGTELVVVAFDGSPSAGPYGRRQPLDRTSVTGRAIVDGVTVHTPDILALDPAEFGVGQEFARRHGNRATLAAPLLREGRAVGGILLAKLAPIAFTPRQIELLESFAAQAVIALENTRLFTELRESLDQQTATAEVLQVINSSPGDTTPVFEAILQKAHALCAIAYGSLQLYDGEKFRAVATHNLPEPLVKRLREGYVPGPNTRQLVDGAAFAQSADIGIVDEPMAKAAAEGGLRTLLRVALRKDGRLLGQIVCGRTEVRPFADREIALLQGFAAQAVIAMENARLITETREALERQTAMAEVLAAINANPGELAPVFDAILEKAHRLCGSAIGNLSLYDGARLRRVAFRGMSGETSAMVAEPRSISDLHSRLVRGDRFVHVADLDAADAPRTESLTALREREGIRSFVLVPLRREGAFLGYISANWSEPRPNVASEVALLESFADQAVIAIENARLLREQRESLERQTAMAEVLTVINASPGDLTPVFSTILDKALSLSGSRFGNLARFDGEKFWQVAGRNIPPALASHGLGGAVPEAGTLLHRLLRGDDVAHLADIRDDEAYRAGVPSRVLMADEAGVRSLLIVALRKDGRLLGCIHIYRTEVRAFSEAEVTLVRSFADQAVIAMENARLLTETKEALERQTAMAEVLEVISNSVEDTQPVFEKILESCQRLIECTDLSVLTIEADALVHVRAARGPHAWLTIEKYRPVPVGQSVIARAVEEGETVHIRDSLGDDDVPEVNRRLAARFGNLSCLITPLIWRGRCVGAMHVARSLKERNWPSFTDKDISLLEAFADQAVIAMENARLITETREALERQTAMAAVLTVINASPGDLTPVFATILDKALSLSGSSFGILHRFDGEKFWYLAGRNIPPALADFARGGFLPDAGTLMQRLFLGDDVAHLADITDDEAYRAGVPGRVILADEGGARSQLIVALRKDGRLLGCLNFYRTEVRAFSEAEVALVRSFADQAVIAMENARLITETREALEQQTATADILRVISQSPTDVGPVLTAIAKAALRFCGAPDALVSLRDGDDLVPIAHEGVLTAVTVRRKLRHGSAAGRCIMDGRSIEIADMAGVDGAEFPESVEVARSGGWRAALIAPMLRDGVAVGAIHLRRPEPGAFTPRQLQLLESFAAQAVIAIENVRLFTELDARNAELRESLEQQTATAEILRVISQSPTDVQPVLDAVVKAAVRFCGASDTIITLRDGDDLIAAAHEGPLSFSGVGDRRPLDRSSSSGRAIIDGKTIHIPDVTILNPGEFGQLIALAQSHGFGAAISAPMLREGAAIGSVLLRKVDAGPFTQQQIALLETFAAQAVIAIENVRLFTELDARNAELRESLEQQTATADILRVISQSPTDVGPVLQAVVRAAVRLCGAEDSVVALRDGDESVTAAHEGPLGAVIGFRARLDPRGRGTVRAIVERRTIHVPDLMAPDHDEFAISRALGSEQNFRAFVVTPMMREGVAIGSIGLRRRNPGPFTPRQIALLESFAAQAVIAIENVRLFNETKEALERQTATAEILSVISRSPTDVQPVFDVMAQSAMRLLNGWSVLIWRYDGERMRVIASHGGLPGADAASVRAALGEPRPEELPYPGDAILKRTVTQIADADAAGVPDGVREVAHARGWRANIAVPMLHDGPPIGVITVSRKEPGAFTEREIGLLQTFAAQALIAIENVRLFTELDARNTELRESLEQQTATSDILRVISQSPTDVGPVLEAVVKAAVRFCGAEDAVVGLRDGEDHWIPGSHHGPFEWVTGERRPLDGTTALRRAIREARSFHLPDIEAADPVAFATEHRNAREFGYRAGLAAPMLREGVAIGAIALRKREAGAITPRQAQLLESFAAQAVIAIENVRLFTELDARNTELRESLEQQTATAEVLATINANPGELGPVFDAMLNKAMLLCGATVGELRTYDGQDFRQVASRGMPDAYVDYYRNRSVSYGPGTGPARIVAGEPLVHIPDLIDTEAYRRGDPDRVALVELGGARASLIAPLLRGSEVAGMIMLLREQSGPFGDRQIALLRNFAAQAVIAIENARLVTEQREALERQTATAEVLQVINANPGNLTPVFETMLEKACKLCDADSGAFWNLRDGLVLAPVTRGFGPAVVDFLSTPRRVDPETGMGRLMQGHSIAHIVDLAEGPAYRAGDRLHRLAVDEDGIRTLVAVPLRKDGVMLGAFGLTRHKVQAFTDKHIALVESFAAQAVIAMENARLIDEIRTARDAAETSLGDLKIAQANLVQAEKMASLGQLTAGIAHEIKNPLNFVNNFATLSIELLDELKEIAHPALEQLDQNRRAELDETMDLLTGNLGKIAEHGKRADGIVKSMLSHSRSGKGDRTPSDINALVEEALNLAYHGARAQDKEFNISLERDYGPSGDPIDVVPQDIARVFLNLFGNGFYAANKRRLAAMEVGFRPTLRVSTRDLGDAVEVKVRDNGIGIPPDARDKLFQPFFTTKPTGEGTGLGLSISYDIVTQQHAGSIEVESEPNSFTEFTISLPRRRRAASPGERS